MIIVISMVHAYVCFAKEGRCLIYSEGVFSFRSVCSLKQAAGATKKKLCIEAAAFTGQSHILVFPVTDGAIYDFNVGSLPLYRKWSDPHQPSPHHKILDFVQLRPSIRCPQGPNSLSHVRACAGAAWIFLKRENWRPPSNRSVDLISKHLSCSRGQAAILVSLSPQSTSLSLSLSLSLPISDAYACIRHACMYVLHAAGAGFSAACLVAMLLAQACVVDTRQ
jgi:hypothetical protein